MVKRWIMMLLVAVPMLTMADDYGYLKFTLASGAEQSVAVDNLVITFSGGQLLATNSEGTVTLTLADLASMAFSTEATGIDGLTLDADEGDAQVEIFDLSGRKVTGQLVNSSTRQLPKGVYVVKKNGKTQKIAVQ